MQSGVLYLSLPAAVAVLDLHAAGVLAEMADTPFDWHAAPAKPAPIVPVVAPVAAPTPFVAPAQAPAPLMPRAAAESPIQAPVVAQPAPMAHAAPGTLWHAGEPGGTCVLLCGDAPLAGVEKDLLDAMLRAVGLADTPLAFAGAETAPEPSALVQGFTMLAPCRMLVLGQEALAFITGTKVGVEGWHAGAKPAALPPALHAVLDGVALGVTYPPALLVRQPLFKRLAWRHLLAWQANAV